MNTSTISKNARAGSVILPVVLVILVVSGVCAISIQNSMSAMSLARRQYSLEQAQLTAESGLEEGARRIAESIYLGGSNTVFTYTMPGGDGTATVTLRPLSIMGNAFELTSVGTVDGRSKTVRIDRLYIPTFAQYGLYMEDYRNAYFTYDQVTDGKAYIGTDLYVAASRSRGGPTFTDLLQVGGSSVHNYNGRDSYGLYDIDYVDFQNGWSLNVPKPPIGGADFTRTAVAAQTLDGTGKGLYFQGETQVRFFMKLMPDNTRRGYVAFKNQHRYGDTNWHEMPQAGLDLVYVTERPGTQEWVQVTTQRWDSRRRRWVYTTTWELQETPGSPADVTIYRNRNDTESSADGEDRWEGYVTTDLSIFADRTINIEGHIRYWDDVVANPTSDHKLMLVAKDDIWFDQTWRSDRSDMYVQAALMAAGIGGNTGVLGVRDYDDSDKGPLGTLHFFGSYVAEQYGYSGTFNNSGPRSGFSANRSMDYRFVTMPPPFAPVLSAEFRYAGWHNLN